MNTKLRQKANSSFEKNFFKLMNNVVLQKTMENMRKHRNINVVTAERSGDYLVSEQNNDSGFSLNIYQHQK